MNAADSASDILFLLHDDFQDPAYGGRRFYCLDCATIEGVLLTQKSPAPRLDIRRVAWPRPRQEVVHLAGESNQSLPLLILAAGEKSEHQTGFYQGRVLIAERAKILLALAERHGFQEPHP